MTKVFCYFIGILYLSSNLLSAQSVSIKQFGAIGDGRSFDHQAFLRASAFINKKKRNVTLTIPAGTYIIGKQTEGYGGNFCASENIFELTNCSKIKIIAAKGVIIRYADNLKFGSFDPITKQAFEPKLPFYDKSRAAQLGCFILLQNCKNIQLLNLVVDGNSDKMILGGKWGDMGYQLSHFGLRCLNSTAVTIENAYFHHFALDGISIRNDNMINCGILIKNCRLEYNARCGLSWGGGNGLKIENSSFSYTGKGKVGSSPGCGLDIESENEKSMRNGIFINCTFENNSGCGLTADSGPSSNNSFIDCTFWGVTSWSVWVQKPSYQFTRCNFYGSFVHGYITTNPEEATRFESCRFEDKLYKGQELYGTYLLESDGRKLMYFNQCTFTANKKKVMWYNGAGQTTNDKAQFLNCTINVKTNALNQGDFYAVMRRMNINNLSLNLYSDKAKNYYLSEDGSSITNLNRKEYSK